MKEQMSKRVVIVEDDQFIQKAYSLSLTKAGFDVHIVEEGLNALESIKKKKPELVLLDIILPGKNGFEILKEIKAVDELQVLPVIIITNLEQESDVKKGYSLGAIDYIPKTVTPIHDVVKKINLILR
jgi:two-component system alkaline phosphatase synthesis response regulator PhoP